MAAFLLADAHAFRVVAMCAEGRGARGADPLVAALVAFLLLLQALLQRLHQLLEAAQGLDFRHLLRGKHLLGELLEPFLRDFSRLLFRDEIQPVEALAEDLIELVDVLLVLHQGRAGEVVELVHPIAGDVLLHRFQQGQVLA